MKQFSFVLLLPANKLELTGNQSNSTFIGGTHCRGNSVVFFCIQDCEIKDFKKKMKQNNNNDTNTPTAPWLQWLHCPKEKQFLENMDSDANVEWHENCEIDNDKFEEKKKIKQWIQRNPIPITICSRLSNHTDTIANQFNTYSISFPYSLFWTIWFGTRKKKHQWCGQTRTRRLGDIHMHTSKEIKKTNIIYWIQQLWSYCNHPSFFPRRP